ncbi:MAG: molybdopterin-dependent oxidoreductase [Acidobacteriaceae bacterium]|nr:molybdopterin-dependent oxidoreductase [Acidobacteriaceae bacterium]
MLDLEFGTVAARPVTRTGLDRREFLQSVGGGLLVLVATIREAPAQESGRGWRGGEALPENVSAWLHIAPDNTITAFTGKVEIGQNARTSLTQAVADELRCEMAAVRLVMGDTDQVPWDAGTFGSRTTPTMVPELRKMAATAREALMDAAAKAWSVDRNGLSVANQCITDPKSGKTARFGELASNIDWVHVVGKDDCVTPAWKWQVAGTSATKINAREIVTGKHRYASDHTLPEMMYGRVLRAPSFGAKLVSVNITAAAQIPGVTVMREGDFIAVAARDEHTAAKAITAIDANWNEHPQISNRELFSYIKQNVEGGEQGRRGGRSKGSVEAGLQSAAKTLNSTYTVAYIAHVPLEPRASVAEWKNGKLTLWTGTQRPFGVREELVKAFGIPESEVRVIVPDTGSGYGGKHTGECAVEAARLSKHAGKPVKVIWTREEEFTWAYVRPAGVIDVKSGVTGDGKLTAWDFHNYLSGPSAIDTPYEVPNQSVQFHPAKSPLRHGSYRGLAATANHFARESHMDELAGAVGMDPLAFRLANLKDERIRAVLQTAADRFGWPRRRSSPRQGFGQACGFEKGGYVGCCVEISIASKREVRIERIVEAWDCGAVINPEQLKKPGGGSDRHGCRRRSL